MGLSALRATLAWIDAGGVANSPPGNGAPAVERMSGADLSTLWPEDFGWPDDIGVIGVLDGALLVHDGGRLDMDAVRNAIGSRLWALPRLRQTIYRPRLGLGRPLWLDCRTVDLSYHVRQRALGSAADEAQLLAICEELREAPLDRSQPLWQLWLLPGLAGGRIGMYLRAHHAIADGVAGVALLGGLLGPAGGGPSRDWSVRPAPTSRQLLRDNTGRRWADARKAIGWLAHPVRGYRKVRAAWPALREFLGERRAPATSLNRPIGRQRRMTLIRADLDAVRHAAHDAGATVNDVVLCAVAGGIRELLRSRGELVDGLVLRVALPMALHDASAGPRGNLVAPMVVDLPVGEGDDRHRLRLIRDDTRQRKAIARPQPFTGAFASPWLQRLMVRLSAWQRVVNVYVANVPGPRTALDFAGSRLLALYPVVPIVSNVTIGVGVLSYAGDLNINVVVDRDSCPDTVTLVAGLRRTLADLCALESGVAR